MKVGGGLVGTVTSYFECMYLFMISILIYADLEVQL